jgi:hypothetical protein
MYPLPCEAFACLEVWSLGHDGSVLLSVVAQALFCNFLVCRFSFSSSRRCWWRLSVGTLCFWELDSILEPIIDIELPKEVFTSRARWMPFIIEWNASANMFYLLKHLLLLILVISKLKCNNLNVQWNYDFEWFVCVFACILASSRITLNGSWKADPSFLRWFCHNACCTYFPIYIYRAAC